MKISVASIALLSDESLKFLADDLGVPWKGRHASHVHEAISKINLDEEEIELFKELRAKDARNNTPTEKPANGLMSGEQFAEIKTGLRFMTYRQLAILLEEAETEMQRRDSQQTRMTKSDTAAPVIDMTKSVKPEGESSALSVSYYLCPVNNPNQAAAPYVAECSDIQEALGMTHAEGEIFAALWRKCAARTLGRNKAGNSAVRDAEKCYHYAKRVLSVETGKKID